jgi:hypothetical protein
MQTTYTARKEEERERESEEGMGLSVNDSASSMSRGVVVRTPKMRKEGSRRGLPRFPVLRCLATFLPSFVNILGAGHQRY